MKGKNIFSISNIVLLSLIGAVFAFLPITSLGYVVCPPTECVKENTPPQIQLKGDNPLEITVGQTFVEPGYTATDAEDGDLTDQVVIVSNNVDTSVVGTYEIVYKVSDSGQPSDVVLSASAIRQVIVLEDMTPPIISKSINLVAKKIVCDSEADLPNWGAGGPDITSSSASEFLATHPNCKLESDWSFQWANSDTADPGSAFVGEAFGWNTFGPTNSNGVAETTVTVTDNTSFIWVREVLKEDYLTFSHPAINDSYSAEMYCHTDVMNYDNYDKVEGPFSSNYTYHCIAFNVSTAVTPSTNTPPTITLSGANPLNLTVGQTFVEPGYTATDAEDGDLTASTTVTGTVDTNTAGTYEIVYSVTDSGGLSASTTRTVIVKVKDAPVVASVSLTANPQTIVLGATSTLTWNAQNASSCSAIWTSSTSTSGSIDVAPTTTTEYVISCAGDYGNAYATTTVTVTTSPAPTNTPPTITLSGANPLNLTVGQTFVEPGYTATDAEDGDLTASTTVTGTVDTNTAGTYEIVYSVTDSGGLSASTTRTVIVKVKSTPSSGGGGGSSLGGRRHDISNLLATDQVQGEILGAATCSYLNDYLRIDWKNDPIEVLKLQSFLNAFEGENLSLTGVFDQATFKAVERFQIKYNDDVLNPWGYADEESTGFVYILTKKKVNEIFCQTVYPLTSAQQDEINAFRNYYYGIYGYGSDKISSIEKAVSADLDSSASVASSVVVLKDNSTSSSSTSTASTAVSVVKNAAVSLFALPQKIFSNSRSIIIFLILAAIVAAIISLFRSSSSDDSSSNDSSKGSGSGPTSKGGDKSKGNEKDSPVIILPSADHKKDHTSNKSVLVDEEIVIENPDEEELIIETN
jgi:hypothetical protein